MFDDGGGSGKAIQFFQKSSQMKDSLIDAVSFVSVGPVTMHETQSDVVGLLRILDFTVPCSRACR